MLIQHVAFPGEKIPRDVRPLCPEYPGPFYLTQPPAGLPPVEATQDQIDLTVASTTVPQPVSATDLFVSEYRIRAKRTNAVYCKFGYTAGNETQLWELEPTEWMSRTAPAGKKFNLAKVYVDVGANNDGVIVDYTF